MPLMFMLISFAMVRLPKIGSRESANEWRLLALVGSDEQNLQVAACSMRKEVTVVLSQSSRLS